MAILRAVQHLEAVSRDYPGVWRQYAQFIAIRDELGDWPPWCFCPMAAAYAVVSGGGDATVPLSRSLEIARLAALAAWRQTQGVYRLDPTLLAELLETPLDGDVPAAHLERLPEWCVYVELGLPGQHGFFAHLEWDANEERTELRLLLDTDDGLQPMALHLGGTIQQSVAGFVAYANAEIAKRKIPVPALGAPAIEGISRVAARLVSVLLYLCAGDAETRPTRDPKRTHEPARLRRNKRGEPYLPPAERPEVWETGYRLGAALRAAQESSPAGGRTVRGHIRRAHWHSFWRGSGDERRIELRWLPPIAVNLDVPEKATVRKVRPE